MNKICKIFLVILGISLVISLIFLFMSLAHNSFLIELYEDFANSIIIDPSKFFKKLSGIIGIVIGFQVLAIIIFIIIGVLTKNKQIVSDDNIDLVSENFEVNRNQKINILMEEELMSRKEKRDAKKIEAGEVKPEKKTKKVEETKVEAPKPAAAPAPTEAPRKMTAAEEFLYNLKHRK